ncbi:helix-turn-helix domain-containing protein [Haladaptatus halobius]|uniref:helix-turn-helix domain-containing protein n=1 Tax=Haladaptatus halobius TaxID=2884875 RepID=UPI001D0B5C88|nr:helix-turn-helix domain-containing protein [Haladaptatus halobius]
MFVATFSIPADGFALGHALDAAPDITVKAERIAAHGTVWVMPCLWVAGDDLDAFDAALEADPTVDTIVMTEKFNEEGYYQVEWSDAVEQFINALIDTEGSILNAETHNGNWRLRIRFATRDQFEDFQDYLAEQNHPFRLLDLYEPSSPRQEMGELTTAQRDALVAAVEQGYYRIPRDATMEEVANTLDISSQAASERLRRGIDQLVTKILITPKE